MLCTGQRGNAIRHPAGGESGPPAGSQAVALAVFIVIGAKLIGDAITGFS